MPYHKLTQTDLCTKCIDQENYQHLVKNTSYCGGYLECIICDSPVYLTENLIQNQFGQEEKTQT